ncbi:MAG TPA: S1-like domain-containing RNA-binding protein [Clostridia bacterium]
MIELGKSQKLQIVRMTQIGAYLNSKCDKSKDDVLLPKSQVPKDIKVGDEIEVFIYKDSEDRMISTVKKPKITMGELNVLQVVETTNIGAFLDWGLEKDLFLPFREQVGKVIIGGSYLVALYIDSSNRLCATMNIYNLLSNESPYKENDRVHGTVYSISKELGAFVAVDNKYQGLIPNKELYGDYKEGNSVHVRIKKVRQDGKLELSLRNEAYNEIESDTQKIMDRLELMSGALFLNDKSSPEDIKAELNMSKAAFKRAVGRLLKEGAIKITDDGISRMW